jgi:RNA polymerase-binding transcription factor DksA
MHIHGMNPSIESNAAYAAERANAKREAEAFRKKLSESVNRLVAGDEDCIVSIDAQQKDAQDQPQQEQEREKKQKNADAEQKEVRSHISDWA